MSLKNESQVIEFYNKKAVFITGATGFMGKVEKYQYCIRNNFTCASLGSPEETIKMHKCYKSFHLDEADERLGHWYETKGTAFFSFVW